MEPRRDLPSVDQVVQKLQNLLVPRPLLLSETRKELQRRREGIANGEPVPESPVESSVEQRLKLLLAPSLRPVINATGVVLHTNLGRAPLATFTPIPRYSNLEYDIAEGKRGKRDTHTAGLLDALIDRPAVLVNNNAGAVFLVLNELAAGHEVIVSRGELIEIGDGFRIPEIMHRSGAILREVGTTNRTNLDDYASAINDRTKLILRVHPSNFRVTGFTARPELADLARLGRDRGIPVYEDLGSGCLVDLRSAGIDEPLVRESFAAGVNVASFSCDKLLGGPQTGIIAGDRALVGRVRRNPLYRAFRVDKLVIEALTETLRNLLLERWDRIPTLQMILASDDELRVRAERVAAEVGKHVSATVSQDGSPVGGGSAPDVSLNTWVVRVAVADPTELQNRLRRRSVPVIARVQSATVILDMRTVADSELDELVQAVREALT